MKLTIGADPEIALVNPLSDKYISAQTVLSAGTDRPFGLDGNPTTIEIRPQYADDPMELIENINTLLIKASKEFPQVFRLELKPSNPSVIVGGHLHFGHEKLLITDTRLKVTMALDVLLSPLIACVENPTHRQSRLQSNYGKVGDYRSAPWGVEYRTPASWIGDRRLAEGVCCLGYAIVDEVLKNGIKLPIPHKELAEVYNHNMTETIKFYIPTIAKTIKGIPTPYHHKIEYLLSSAKAGRCLFDGEVKKAWHIKYTSFATMKAVSLKRLVIKLGQALAVPNEPQQTKWLRFGKDYRVKTIANNVSVAIEKIIGVEFLELLPEQYFPYVRGIKYDRGNVIEIYIPKLSQRVQLIKLITELCTLFEYPIPTIKIGQGWDIYLPRQMRELNNYLSEAVCLVVWLFCNRKVYKSETKTKTGKIIKLPFGVHNVIEPLVGVTEKLARPTPLGEPDFIDDGGEIMIDKLYKYCKTYILPRIAQQIELGHRTRLPVALRANISSARYMSGDNIKLRSFFEQLFKDTFD